MAGRPGCDDSELRRGDGPEGLLAATARCDRQAFALLVRDYGPRVRRYFLARGVSAGLVEDVVQETMLTVWRKAHLYDPQRGSAATWLFAIARTAMVSLARRERVPTTGHGWAESSEGQHEPRERIERLSDLQRALARLPPAQADVLVLSYQGHSMTQIANKRQLPLGTVKTRARLALARLWELYGDRED